jgi:hypothetical protein
MTWDVWKKGFDAWEDATARWLEQWLESPLVLGPSGTLLGVASRAKAAADRAAAQWPRRSGGARSACRPSATRSARSTR